MNKKESNLWKFTIVILGFIGILVGLFLLVFIIEIGDNTEPVQNRTTTGRWSTEIDPNGAEYRCFTVVGVEFDGVAVDCIEK